MQNLERSRLYQYVDTQFFYTAYLQLKSLITKYTQERDTLRTSLTRLTVKRMLAKMNNFTGQEGLEQMDTTIGEVAERLTYSEEELFRCEHFLHELWYLDN